MSLSPDLGEVQELALAQGRVRYRERGSGPPLVFVHGLIANGDLWRKVVPKLADRFRCITPDLPLGSHELPLQADADLSIPGVARLLADFVAALELDAAPTLIANDTGGAITQVLMTEHPEVAGSVVLTPCDCFDNFLPPVFTPLLFLARNAQPLLTTLIQAYRFQAVRRLPLGYGWLSKYGIDAEIEANFIRPLLANREIRRDCYKVLADITPEHTQRAAEGLRAFPGRVLVAWAADDRFFPIEHGRRIAGLVPDGTFRLIEDSYTFVSEDQPETLAKEIRDFLDR